MADVLCHYHMFDYRARAAVAITTDTVREAQRRHGLDPITTIAFGRAVSCAALLASTLKQGREYVHCTFAGRGLLSKVIAECNGDGHCRGYCTPPRLVEVLPPSTPVPETVGEATGDGEGLLTVTRGSVGDKAPYTAVCELQNGEIATDIARFLTDSEQIPSAVAAGVKLAPDGSVVAAGGVLVQRLGGAELGDDTLSQLETRMNLRLHLSDRIAAGESVDTIVAFLQGAPTGFGKLTERPLQFQCTCSRDRMSDALMALGETQLREIRKETGKLEVRCQYCGEARHFTLEELTTH